ncbi:UDP-glucose 4-epimerase GalE [Helicobacter equorum]|uniref:UDP-glucose 4-epimerase GalE n=1 Tax=Helicobacter equorum TaxID=361872 RepID=UPI001F19DF41|nr:UDP-glucose 4-epimerase GalE [Helicobacter equorum]
MTQQSMTTKKILITGGAGYIGSHANALLNALGFETLVLDNLSLGHKESLQYTSLDVSSGATLTQFLAQLGQNLPRAGGGGHKYPLNNPFKESKSNDKHFADTNLSPHIAQYQTQANSDLLLLRSLQNAHLRTTFIQADLSDKATLDSVFDTYDIEAVMHFAAYAYVGESVNDPSKYYRNNVANSLNLLESMRRANVKNIIFSSTCATYGNPLHLPITESHIQNPINPYGYSKLVVENMLRDFHNAYGLNYVVLRYFNAAGASMLFDIGESHNPETHLIPLLLQTALGQRESLSIFGDDYPTKDGSCVRDYIHIDDLASAHILALKYFLDAKRDGKIGEVFNLGNGEGFSIFELLECTQDLCGKKIPYVIESRRIGDPAILIGDSSRARDILGWNPYFYKLETILASALRWHTNPRY